MPCRSSPSLPLSRAAFRPPIPFLTARPPPYTILAVATAAILTKLLGWHWAFLPTLAAELIPGLDMFPTWTAAVFFVTRQRVRPATPEGPEILPPGPAPAPRS